MVSDMIPVESATQADDWRGTLSIRESNWPVIAEAVRRNQLEVVFDWRSSQRPMRVDVIDVEAHGDVQLLVNGLPALMGIPKRLRAVRPFEPHGRIFNIMKVLSGEFKGVKHNHVVGVELDVATGWAVRALVVDSQAIHLSTLSHPARFYRLLVADETTPARMLRECAEGPEHEFANALVLSLARLWRERYRVDAGSFETWWQRIRDAKVS